MATYTERLQKVQDAIDAILTTGQAIGDDGSTLTRANLDALRRLEIDYRALAAAEARAAQGQGRNRIRYVIPC